MKHLKTSSSLLSKENLFVFLVFSVLVGAFYEKAILEDYTFIFVDSSRFFYPLWKWGANILNQGTLPLWNPDAQFGTPYFADAQMAFSYPPLLLLYYFLSPTNAFNWIVVIHHLWALLGFWVFARSQGLSRPAAFYGSLTFAFSLHVICSSWVPVALMTISWLPWIFWAAEGLLNGEKKSWLLLSFFFALQLSAGYPVLSYLTGFALFLDLAWRTGYPFLEFRWRNFQWFFPLLLSVGMAGAYNLVWELPFLEFFRSSNFGNGAEHFQALGLADLATWVAPFYQGHPLLSGYHGPHYWVGTYFTGLPTVLLMIWGFWKGKLDKNLTLGWALFFILCLGETLWVGGWLKKVLPGYHLVIRSGFWLSIVLFWTARLSAQSADGLLEKPKRSFQRIGWLALALLVYGASFSFIRPFFPIEFFVSFLLVLGAVLPPISSRKVRWALLCAALAFSLAPEARSINIMLESFYYDAHARILDDLPKPGRFFFAPSLMEEAHVIQGDNMADAYEKAKQRLYPNWPLTYSREEIQMYNTFVLPRPGQWSLEALKYSKSHSRAVLDYMNARYVFGNCRFKDFAKVSPSGSGVEVSENPTPLPKWFSVIKARPSFSMEADFSLADRRHLSYGRECCILDDRKTGNYFPRNVSEIIRTPQRVELLAEGRGKSLLVSSETDYPGWKVRVEGREKPMERVNHVFRGVVLRDGETHVVFSFEPFSFRLGLFFALLVCGLWTGLLLKRTEG